MSLETSPIGTARPCCLVEEEISQNGEPIQLQDVSIQEIFSSDYMQDLRQQFIDNKRPTTCKKCWNEEDAGRTSKRMNSAYKFKHLFDKIDFNNLTPQKIYFLDLKLGNICNLKCRICGSWSSSKWAGEEIDYLKQAGINKEDIKKHTAYDMLRKGHWPRKSPKFWTGLYELLPDVTHFEFTGGEPFLIEEHFDLLHMARKHQYSKNIMLHYNTNATVYPYDRVHLWKDFKHVEIAFSIDDIGKRFEYQRYGANWDNVNQNIDKFVELSNDFKNISLQVCFTINILNVLYIDQLIDWCRRKKIFNIHWNMLHGPEEFCIASLPEEQKELVIKKLKESNIRGYEKNVLDTIKFIQNGVSLPLEEIHEKIKKTDMYRNQHLKDNHPELAKILNYE